MRFRIRSGGPSERFVFDRTPAVPQKNEKTSHAPTAAELDNPYGRCYGRTRSWEDILKNK